MKKQWEKEKQNLLSQIRAQEEEIASYKLELEGILSEIE